MLKGKTAFRGSDRDKPKASHHVPTIKGEPFEQWAIEIGQGEKAVLTP